MKPTTLRIKEVRTKENGMFLVAKGMPDEDGAYQVWSSGSDDDEIRNPTHGVMFASFEEEDDDKVMLGCGVLWLTLLYV